jgi:NAD(P)-dependent dehydrogenase (short-subunit alcohol dehydrogenase family)
MSVTYNFEGRVALVTGGNSSMGLATARAFARAGAAVTVASLGEASLGLEEIRSVGGKAIGVRCDVADEIQAAMVERAVVEVQTP